MSERDTGRQRTRLSKAEIKAYESRRAAERARIMTGTAEGPAVEGPEVLQHSYSMTRNDEFQVIKADLIRLLWIVGLLVIALIAATFVFG